MSKECQSCVKEGIGCDSIQKIMRDIDELKKAKAHKILLLSIFFITIAFLVISFIVWHQMLRQPIMAQQMPASQLKDVSELFNAQFSNLLTVLSILITIFGFILPLVNLYYQRQTLKEERESLKHEIDRSLEIIKEQVVKFDSTLQNAKEERKVEIDKVRNDLAGAIKTAQDNFKRRQDSLDQKLAAYDDKLADYQKNRSLDNGYFMHQLAMAAQEKGVAVIYYCNALLYLTKYNSEKDVQQRIDFILKSLESNITQMPKGCPFQYAKDILDKLNQANNDLSNNYLFSTKINEIIKLLNERTSNNNS